MEVSIRIVPHADFRRARQGNPQDERRRSWSTWRLRARVNRLVWQYEVEPFDWGNVVASGRFCDSVARPDSRYRPQGIRSNQDRKSTRLNSSHLGISYAVF